MSSKELNGVKRLLDNDELDYSDVNLAQFISNEYSICREERQYALYLYNLINKLKYVENLDWLDKDEIIEYSINDKKVSLKNCAEDIINKCGILLNEDKHLQNIELQGVYYEATFMRDIFERLRRIDCYKSLKNRNKNSNLLYKTCNIDIDYDYYQINAGENEKIDARQAYSDKKGIRNAQEFNQRLIEFIIEKMKPDLVGDRTNNESTEVKDDVSSAIHKIYEDNKNKVRPVNLGHNKIFIENEDAYLTAKKIYLDAKKNGLENADKETYKKLKDAYSKEKAKGSNRGLDDVQYIAQCMMNAKPDIAVIYKSDGVIKLKFIECKFESAEGRYENNITQLMIQNYIGEFLHKYYDIQYSGTTKVEFSRERCIGKLMIGDLIKINEQIMGT